MGDLRGVAARHSGPARSCVAPGGYGAARRYGAALLAAGALAAVLSGCASGTTVESQAQQVYFQVPSGWRVFDQSQLEGGALVPALSGSAAPQFLAIAAAGPRPRPGAVFTASGYPWVISLVRPLSSAEQANISFEGLSDVVFNVDQAAQFGTSVQFNSQPQILVHGNLRGTRLSVNYNGNVDYVQVAWVNPATDKVWVLMAGCSVTCFQRQQGAIDRVVQSFYVSDRGTR